MEYIKDMFSFRLLEFDLLLKHWEINLVLLAIYLLTHYLIHKGYTPKKLYYKIRSW